MANAEETASDHAELAPASRTHWFLRGFVAGILICGACNAVSYFFRSDGLGDLLGLQPQHVEAIGFPVLTWEEGNTYGGYFVDYPALGVNTAFSAAVSSILGMLTVRYRQRLDELMAAIERSMNHERGKFQFSMRGLLLVTLVACVLAAAARQWIAGRPEALGAIYLLGPWMLIGVAFLPRNIAWQQRVVILVPITLLMIGAAVLIGRSLPQAVAADKVLMGIFVCWTPQSVLVATVLTISILRSHPRTD